ncbi:hypothetical protein [Bradyrhizobium brasilense]|uniref:hypothetical protein n=1 Tax=Bradyrhizobium brasilense TaxID=1419277 RepID=UPI001E2B0C59|nr:hypothetical protein [Bradyrhizobium brasilense]
MIVRDICRRAAGSERCPFNLPLKRSFRNVKNGHPLEPPARVGVCRLFSQEYLMKRKAALIAIAALVFTPSAMAMPNGLPQAHQIAKSEPNAEQVRWICNPWGRCWWRPTFYGAYAYYPPPPVYHRPPGFYVGRPWWYRRWHHWW